MRSYEPVMLAVGAILAAALWLPSAGDGDRAELAAAPPRAPSTAVPERAPAALDPPAPATPDAPPLRAAPVGGTRAPAVPPTDDGAAPAARAPAVPASAPAPTPERSVLQVRASGWASALGATPLPAVLVPEGTLPVGNRLGQLESVSLVRLVGDETVLVLVEVAEGRRDQLGDPAVMACRILEPGWVAAEGQPLDDAPEWDTEGCAVGTVDDLGHWSFDLTDHADVLQGDNGFALVPTDGAPVDFQVTFRS